MKVVMIGLAMALTGMSDAPPRSPGVVGTCHRSSVKAVGQRLEDGSGQPVEGSGSAVELADGTPGVSYDQVDAVNASKPGDPVLVCLVKLPTNCPKGDDRGKWYTTTNLRTMQSWTLPDAEHMCGGA